MRHYHFPKKSEAKKVEVDESKNRVGIDAPFPKRRKIERAKHAIEHELVQPERKKIRLNPGGKLALRFPHLVADRP